MDKARAIIKRCGALDKAKENTKNFDEQQIKRIFLRVHRLYCRELGMVQIAKPAPLESFLYHFYFSAPMLYLVITFPAFFCEVMVSRVTMSLIFILIFMHSALRRYRNGKLFPEPDAVQVGISSQRFDLYSESFCNVLAILL